MDGFLLIITGVIRANGEKVAFAVRAFDTVEDAEALGRDMTDLIVPPALRAGHRAGMEIGRAHV